MEKKEMEGDGKDDIQFDLEASKPQEIPKPSYLNAPGLLQSQANKDPLPVWVVLPS